MRDVVMLELKDKPVIARGNRQFVYAHPHDPSLLVKVPQPGTFDKDGHIPKAGLLERRFRRATMYKGFLREFREYLELVARWQDADAVLPVCAVRGTEPTDLGLGLVYERISDPDGSLPPSLHEMVEAGTLRRWHLPLLDAFFDSLVQNHVVVSNGNPGNIIFQSQGDRSGRFVWIDSFGCKQAIPYRKWSKMLNARRLEKIRTRFLSRARAALTAAESATSV